MDTVDKNEITGPVKIGIGDKSQHRALMLSGAEEIHTHLLVRDILTDEPLVVRTMFRPIDEIVMVQPDLLSVSEIQKIARRVTQWTVPGNDTMNPYSERLVRQFRKMKAVMPKDEKVKRVERRGAKPVYPQPTEADMKYILDRWYSGDKLADVCDDVRKWMKADFPNTWVRDRVKKHTGSAARTRDE